MRITGILPLSFVVLSLAAASAPAFAAGPAEGRWS
jgi:hypothetical protein